MGQITSPYHKTCIPEVLNWWVKTKRPKHIIEFGTGQGFCTSILAQDGARVESYDRFAEPFMIWQARWNLRKFPNVKVRRLDFVDWLPNTFGMMWLDCGPTGTILRRMHYLWDKCLGRNGHVLFEGGIPERDRYGRAYALNDPMVGSCPYAVINEEFPGISVLV